MRGNEPSYGRMVGSMAFVITSRLTRLECDILFSYHVTIIWVQGVSVSLAIIAMYYLWEQRCNVKLCVKLKKKLPRKRCGFFRLYAVLWIVYSIQKWSTVSWEWLSIKNTHDLNRWHSRVENRGPSACKPSSDC